MIYTIIPVFIATTRHPFGQTFQQPVVITQATPTPPAAAVVQFESVFRPLVLQKYNVSYPTVLNKKEVSSVLTYTLVHFSEPAPVLKALIDVHAKEYINSGTEPDMVDLEAGKERRRIQGSGFTFTMTQGIYFNPIDCTRIGPRIFGSGMDTPCQEHNRTSEKIVVPPGRKINIKVKTWIMKYEGEAIIDVGAPADCPITFMHNDLNFCGLHTTRRGTITMQEIFQTQPSYRKVGNMVYYRGKFRYTYNGEQFDLHKVEERLA